MNQPANLNLPEHYRGDTFEPIDFLIADADVPTLAGCSVKMDFRKVDKSLVDSFSTANGKLEIVLPQTVRMLQGNWTAPSGEFTYDLQVTTAAGKVYTYVKGKWKIVEDVTK
jgi:hypothetical protein